MGRGGGLDALEQQAGALGVERVVGDAEGDLGQCDLDGADVREHREAEGFLALGDAGAAGRRARRVVVIAEGLAAESEGAAAVSGGMGVGATELRVGNG